MAGSIINVQNLSKRFIISHESKERYTSLRDVIARQTRKYFFFNQQNVAISSRTKEEFWALKDVNFQVNRGERVGIVGRNGAGKSTLLKILSRISEPTKGRIDIDGRMASLLEVGTGFHPELTGRENIFLNGAILGMKRSEIRKKFDEIVAFAEVEKFLDTPVKRYSSGMYVRLAFAVAAHLEPEILIVDEVLAVGDAQFQKKCLGKMQDVSREEGRTVLFVSHNMLAVKSLCTTGLLLNRGQIEIRGAIEDVIHHYMLAAKTQLASHIEIDKVNKGLALHSLTVSNNGIPGNFNIEDELVFEIEVSSDRDFDSVNINLFFKANDDAVIFASCSAAGKLPTGSYRYKCVIPANTLNDIIYTINLMVVSSGPEILHNIKDVISIEGVEGAREGAWLGRFPGMIRPLYYQWTKSKTDETP